MDWQPIETAPRKRVLLYYPPITGSSHASNNRPEMWQIGFASEAQHRKPTHWAKITRPGA